MSTATSTLTEKIKTLNSDELVEVENFVESLRLRGTKQLTDRGLVRNAATASSPAFEAVWDNTEDAAYDVL